MRVLLCVSVLLMSGCATAESTLEPSVKVAYGDLDPRRRADQDVLMARVRASANAFCAENGEAVTPRMREGERDYCHRVVRVRLVDQLPDAYRQGYDRAWARSDRQMP